MPQGKVTLFAKKDKRVPMPLKARIGKWREHPPTSQFQQYGPINKYLNAKFNRANHMIKPQALFRTPIDSNDNALLVTHGSDREAELPADMPEEVRDQLEDLRNQRHAGDITIDSIHADYVSRSNMAGQKYYPDFVVCEYADNENDLVPSENNPKDKVRVIIEIATLPRDIKDKAKLDLKRKTVTQLREYMDLLDNGVEYERNKVLGMALVGTDVAFVLPEENQYGEYEWVHTGGRWYSIFDSTFQKMMDWAAKF
ncbi:hypothetical protein BD311DRAFT_752605 [Dichomitus squalens]|uniref:Uncharacterized protein n=1 Tax=Dichomitus squalens TaxID=114155 RepID=A0A4Q9MU31_9APHY|nr:hypothetical protein BD311DRAFT_752605 [Dichomitus squalens]